MRNLNSNNTDYDNVMAYATAYALSNGRVAKEDLEAGINELLAKTEENEDFEKDAVAIYLRRNDFFVGIIRDIRNHIFSEILMNLLTELSLIAVKHVKVEDGQVLALRISVDKNDDVIDSL